MSTRREFHLPERPFTPIDSLNRRAAALGSPRYAMATGHANYNGHHVTLDWNDYRRYYIAQYYWAERIVIARGTFEHCLAATLEEYNRGALGSSAAIYPREDDAEAIALCAATAELRPGKEPPREWYTWQHECAAASARDYANPRGLVMIFDWGLMQASPDQKTYEEALRATHGRVYTS